MQPRWVSVIWKIVFLTALALLAARGTRAQAADQSELVVQLLDGREVRGQFDPHSDAQSLVLATSRAGITLRRTVSWKRVSKVVSGGNPVSVEALQARATSAQPATQSRTIVIHTLKTAPASGPVLPAQSETAESRLGFIKVDASIANWDADVETDGLVLDLELLDVQGSPVAASGTVEVELFMPQRRTFDLAPLSGGDTLELVERWTRAVDSREVGPSGVRLKLPFGAVHPELRPDWAASHYGLVHVRFAAPHHGVFEASRDGVRVVPWAPNRDRLEMQSGGRFLWTERLGRPE